MPKFSSRVLIGAHGTSIIGAIRSKIRLGIVSMELADILLSQIVGSRHTRPWSSWLGRKPPKLPTRDERNLAGIQIPAAAPSIFYSHSHLFSQF